MEEFYPIIQALSDGIVAIATSISKFDIMAVDTQKLAFAGQYVADAGKIVYHLVRAIIILINNVKGV